MLQAAALALLSRLFVTSSEFYKISSLSHLGFSLEGGPGLGGGASHAHSHTRTRARRLPCWQ